MTVFRLTADIAVTLYSLLLDAVRISLTPMLRGIAEEKGWDIEKRQKLPSPVRDFRGKRVVWLHAASMGEAKLLLKFYTMLRERNPDDLYLITATTRTGVTFLEKNRKNNFCAIGYQPIDTISLVSRVLSHYTVVRLWLLETELWPSMLRACARRGVPVGIVNGRIEERAYRRYRLFRPLLSELLSPVDIVLAQSDAYAQRFSELGIPAGAVHVVGNLKGHIRIDRPQRSQWLDLRRGLNIEEDAFVVTAGCMHAGEGGALRLFVSHMNRLGYPCKLIVVPRYMEEAAQLLDEIGGSAALFHTISTARKWEVCVIEKMGILDEMYKIADAAVIGGTFTDTGGHNMWDAACFAIPVFFGPDVHTQQASADALLEAGVAFSAQDGASLAERVYTVCRKEPMRFLEAQREFIETTNKKQSVVEPLLP